MEPSVNYEAKNLTLEKSAVLRELRRHCQSMTLLSTAYLEVWSRRIKNRRHRNGTVEKVEGLSRTRTEINRGVQRIARLTKTNQKEVLNTKQ
jgi:hypothetical protein